mmetsp:Transcript_6058/g.12765  ORF Transcript_6058/g.12765 Transcript_6058/m.12765 type:complete len:241 (-) Transcript_6058:166-888(-)
MARHPCPHASRHSSRSSGVTLASQLTDTTSSSLSSLSPAAADVDVGPPPSEVAFTLRVSSPNLAVSVPFGSRNMREDRFMAASSRDSLSVLPKEATGVQQQATTRSPQERLAAAIAQVTAFWQHAFTPPSASTTSTLTCTSLLRWWGAPAPALAPPAAAFSDCGNRSMLSTVDRKSPSSSNMNRSVRPRVRRSCVAKGAQLTLSSTSGTTALPPAPAGPANCDSCAPAPEPPPPDPDVFA